MDCLVDQRDTFRFSADVLPLLATSSYSTTCPSFRPVRPALSIAEICTNTSFPPPCGAINPYPFCELNHFTVPLAISVSNIDQARWKTGPTALTSAQIGRQKPSMFRHYNTASFAALTGRALTIFRAGLALNI